MRSESHEDKRAKRRVQRFEFKRAHVSKTASEAGRACSNGTDDTEHTLIAPDLDDTMEPTKDKNELKDKEEEQDPFDYEDLMLPEEDGDFKKDEKANGGTKL